MHYTIVKVCTICVQYEAYKPEDSFLEGFDEVWGKDAEPLETGITDGTYVKEIVQCLYEADPKAVEEADEEEAEEEANEDAKEQEKGKKEKPNVWLVIAAAIGSLSTLGMGIVVLLIIYKSCTCCSEASR